MDGAGNGAGRDGKASDKYMLVTPKRSASGQRNDIDAARLRDIAEAGGPWVTGEEGRTLTLTRCIFANPLLLRGLTLHRLVLHDCGFALGGAETDPALDLEGADIDVIRIGKVFGTAIQPKIDWSQPVEFQDGILRNKEKGREGYKEGSYVPDRRPRIELCLARARIAQNLTIELGDGDRSPTEIGSQDLEPLSEKFQVEGMRSLRVGPPEAWKATLDEAIVSGRATVKVSGDGPSALDLSLRRSIFERGARIVGPEPKQTSSVPEAQPRQDAGVLRLNLRAQGLEVRGGSLRMERLSFKPHEDAGRPVAPCIDLTYATIESLVLDGVDLPLEKEGETPPAGPPAEAAMPGFAFARIGEASLDLRDAAQRTSRAAFWTWLAERGTPPRQSRTARTLSRALTMRGDMRSAEALALLEKQWEYAENRAPYRRRELEKALDRERGGMWRVALPAIAFLLSGLLWALVGLDVLSAFERPADLAITLILGGLLLVGAILVRGVVPLGGAILAAIFAGTLWNSSASPSTTFPILLLLICIGWAACEVTLLAKGDVPFNRLIFDLAILKAIGGGVQPLRVLGLLAGLYIVAVALFHFVALRGGMAPEEAELTAVGPHWRAVEADHYVVARLEARPRTLDPGAAAGSAIVSGMKWRHGENDVRALVPDQLVSVGAPGTQEEARTWDRLGFEDVRQVCRHNWAHPDLIEARTWRDVLQRATHSRDPIVDLVPDLAPDEGLGLEAQRACATFLPQEYGAFQPWLYAADVIVPLLDLRQEDEWSIRTQALPFTRPGPDGGPIDDSPVWFFRFALFAESLFHVLGWLIALVLAGALTGLSDPRRRPY